MTDEALYVNLKVLAKLQPYQRINTRQVLFQVSPLENSSGVQAHIPEFLRRWWQGSTRDSDFSRIRDLINNATALLKDEKSRERVTVHLRDAMEGLGNLQKTYENDLTFKCRIITLIEHIQQNIGGNDVNTVLSSDSEED